MQKGRYVPTLILARAIPKVIGYSACFNSGKVSTLLEQLTFLAVKITGNYISKTTSDLQYTKLLFQLAEKLALPFAFWRMPDEQTQHFITDFQGGTPTERPDLQEMGSGFLVSPFNTDLEKGLFIRADFHWTSAEQEASGGIFSAIPSGAEAWAKKSAFMEQLAEGQVVEHTQGATAENPLGCNLSQTHFTQAVKKAIHYIEAGAFQKVVLSRSKAVALPDSFDPVEKFHQLCQKYPHAFVSLVSVPSNGLWIGASPEILISIKDQRWFRTISLAGTQPRNRFSCLSEVTWKQKEIEEQALVSRYIINCFKKIRLREFDEEGPKTVEAGHLVHLRTDFLVDMAQTNFPQLGTVMLDLLHPTSAVCGMPKDVATEFIHAEEGYDRRLYSGYLGPVNMEGDTHLFVNPRCANLLVGKALLFAGAGITHDSDPEAEFQETELKMEVMGNILTT
jgi:isochorismate synthase